MVTVPPDRRADVRYTVSDSPLGELFLATTARGLCRVAYGAAGREEEVARCVGGRLRRAPLDAIRRELDEYFDGRRRRFELTLDPRVSPFQLTVLAALAGHIGRHDFSRWLNDVFRDRPLAAHIAILESRLLTDDVRVIVDTIVQAIRARYEMSPALPLAAA